MDSVYVLALLRSLIILEGLTMTRFTEKMLISTRCTCGFMPNLHKKSWMVSNTYVAISEITFWIFPLLYSQIFFWFFFLIFKNFYLSWSRWQSRATRQQRWNRIQDVLIICQGLGGIGQRTGGFGLENHTRGFRFEADLMASIVVRVQSSILWQDHFLEPKMLHD